jgi:hypothetical protein
MPQILICKVGFYKVLGFLFDLCLILLIFSIFGRYWAFLEPKFWEEVGDEQPTSNLYKPGLFEAMRSQGQSEQSYAEEKPSQSHFYAGKLLRSRRCRAISGSSGRPFCVPFSLQGS